MKSNTASRTPSQIPRASTAIAWIKKFRCGASAVAGFGVKRLLGGSSAAADVADDATPTSSLTRTGSGLIDDVYHRAVSWVMDDPDARVFVIRGGDAHYRDLYQLPGELNNKPGVFEWMIDSSGGESVVTHQRFIPGGSVTGTPNQKVKGAG